MALTIETTSGTGTLRSRIISNLLIIRMTYNDYDEDGQSTPEACWELPFETIEEADRWEGRLQEEIAAMPDCCGDYFNLDVQQVLDPRAEALEHRDPLTMLRSLAIFYSHRDTTSEEQEEWGRWFRRNGATKEQVQDALFFAQDHMLFCDADTAFADLFPEEDWDAPEWNQPDTE